MTAQPIPVAISLDGIRKTYGPVVAVERVDFEVRPGELVALVGPNGAGKSTTIRILAGQLSPSEGRVQVAGIDVVADPGAARERVGYVPEEPHLYEYLTAREMIEFVVALRGRGDVARALDLTALGSDADRLIREYSQGMRRKTALACALVAAPPVLVLDEALNGLDPPSAARTGAALREACAAGAAVVLSTHQIDGLERLADRVVMMEGGRVAADLPIAALDQVRSRFGLTPAKPAPSGANEPSG